MKIPQKHFEAIQVARLYYENKKTQEEIAAEVGLSRPTVSRLLKLAHKIGAIQIQVVDPYANCFDLNEELKERFNLHKAIVVPESSNWKRDIARAAASYLIRVLSPGAVLGVSWGSSLGEVVNSLKPQQRIGVEVVQLLGSFRNSSCLDNSMELAHRLSEMLGGSLRLLPAPGIVSDALVREALIRDDTISAALESAKHADVALLGIGTTEPDSGLVRLGAVTPEQVLEIKNAGAVGEICCRLYDINGNTCAREFDQKVLSVTLDQLHNIKYRIGVAGGPQKIAAILGAIRGGHINVLATDEVTAKAILGADKKTFVANA